MKRNRQKAAGVNVKANVKADVNVNVNANPVGSIGVHLGGIETNTNRSDVDRKEKHHEKQKLHSHNNNNQRLRNTVRRSVFTASKLLFVLFGIHQLIEMWVPSNDFGPQQQYDDSRTRYDYNYNSPASIPAPETKPAASRHVGSASGSGSGSASNIETSERYKIRSVVHPLPTNPGDYSVLETMVRNHHGRDKAWYKACEFDNGESWRKNVRNSGVDIYKYFDRGCPHPNSKLNSKLNSKSKSISALRNTDNDADIDIHWNPFHTHDHDCAATSRVNLTIQTDHFLERWSIQTLDAGGVPKTIGGDTFYIVYSEYVYGDDGSEGPAINDNRHPPIPMAVAMLDDYSNGTYGMEFVSIPFSNSNASSIPSKHNGQRKKGRLVIYVISTCFIGELYPPYKDGWNNGGQTNVVWTIENLTRPFRIQEWYEDRYAPLHLHVQPKMKTKRKGDASSDHNLKLDSNSLAGFDRIAFAGDSILTQMVWDTHLHSYHSIVADKIRNGTMVAGPVQEDGSPVAFRVPLSPVTLREFRTMLDPWIAGLMIGAGRTDTGNDNNGTSKANANANSKSTPDAQNAALVLGSAAWDVIWPAEWQGPGFESHLTAVEALLKELREAYPDVTLVWKLPYAQHMHNANRDHCFAPDPETAPDGGSCVMALRYATPQRFASLYQAQKRFLETAFRGDDKVRLLDLYEVSYLAAAGGHWMLPGDSIHYAPEFNALVLEKLLFA